MNVIAGVALLLNHQHLQTAAGKLPRAGQPRKPGPDNYDVVICQWIGASPPLTLQGIAGYQAGKAAEVTISSPQLRNPMRDAYRCNACVMDQGPGNPAFLQQVGEDVAMLLTFTYQHGDRRLEPGVNLINGLRDR